MYNNTQIIAAKYYILPTLIIEGNETKVLFSCITGIFLEENPVLLISFYK